MLLSCNREEEDNYSYYAIPPGFAIPVFPDDNQFTDSRFELGRKLFYDPILSRDSTISCASCHKPEYAFTDRLPVSLGIMARLGSRNAPSLGNVAYHPYLLREGGVPTLEMQVQVPIQEHNEFDDNILLIADKLYRQEIYRYLSLKAYNRLPDPFVITRAIATFERALITGNSSYDQYHQGDLSALSTSALNGLRLFNSDRLKCSQCHSGFNFTNYEFLNNGLYENDPDPGRMQLTGKEVDRSLFKVPGLRNAEITFPYMHDGSIQTLDQVIRHYEKGGKANIHKSKLLTGFTLLDSERADLINFLKSLTDPSFINNPKFKIQ
jgi:cytochrome c peroxidase